MRKVNDYFKKGGVILFKAARGVCEMFGVYAAVVFFAFTDENGLTTVDTCVNKNGVLMSIVLLIALLALGYAFKTEISEPIDNIE